MHVKDLLSLNGKTALITGGSRGLGLAMARGLGEMGARVALVARNAAALDRASDTLTHENIEAQAFLCDLTDRSMIPAMVDDVLGAFGRIDILINNAGVAHSHPTVDFPDAQWDETFEVNLTGPFLLTRDVIKKSMLPNGYGRIINISSVGGIRSLPHPLLQSIAYSASKAGLIHFSRSLAAELGPFGITVNAICPGHFLTDMSVEVSKGIGSEMSARTPLRRAGQGDDLKGISVLLASDAGAYITGQVIAADGGQSLII